MARLEDGINAALIGDQTIQTLLGFPPKVFPVIIPPGLTNAFPCLTFQVISSPTLGSSSDYTMDGQAVRGKRIQIDAWAATYPDVKTIHEAVKAVFDAFTGQLPDGTRILGVFWLLEADHYDTSHKVFRTSVDYTFHYVDSD